MPQRTATELKADMALVTSALDALIAAPSRDTAALVALIEHVRDNARLSTHIIEYSGSVPTWGFRDGRQMVEDVADSASALLREVRSATLGPQTDWGYDLGQFDQSAFYDDAKLSRVWQDIKRNIHPAWFSFINTGQTD